MEAGLGRGVLQERPSRLRDSKTQDVKVAKEILARERENEVGAEWVGEIVWVGVKIEKKKTEDA